MSNAKLGGSLDTVKITILNWEKHQAKSDKLRHPHWFKVRNDLISEPKLFSFKNEEKWVFLCFLCVASQNNNSTFELSLNWFSHQINTESKVVENTIKKLVTVGILTVDRQSTDGGLYNEPSDRREEKRREEIRKEEKRIHTSYVSSELIPDASRPEFSPRTTDFSPDLVLSENSLKKLNTLYPDIEYVKREVVKMQIWLSANQRKAPKSKSGWSRFVLGWLERGWDKYRKGLQSTPVQNRVLTQEELES